MENNTFEEKLKTQQIGSIENYPTINSQGQIQNIPRTIGIIQPLILFILICSWRIILRFLVRKIITKK